MSIFYRLLLIIYVIHSNILQWAMSAMNIAKVPINIISVSDYRQDVFLNGARLPNSMIIYINMVCKYILAIINYLRIIRN